jgi:hypothetical protein
VRGDRCSDFSVLRSVLDSFWRKRTIPKRYHQSPHTYLFLALYRNKIGNSTCRVRSPTWRQVCQESALQLEPRKLEYLIKTLFNISLFQDLSPINVLWSTTSERSAVPKWLPVSAALAMLGTQLLSSEPNPMMVLRSVQRFSTRVVALTLTTSYDVVLASALLPKAVCVRFCLTPAAAAP